MKPEELPTSWEDLMSDETSADAIDADFAKRPPKSLIKKLAEVMQAVETIAKLGHNKEFNYDFAREADVVAAIRRELAKRAVMLFPAIDAEDLLEMGLTSGGSLKRMSRLEMTFTFEDGDTGEKRSFKWRGAGMDTQEKSLYKAMTGAEKYFLLKTFLIPTGDDPERDTKEKRQAQGPPAKPIARPGPSSPVSAAPSAPPPGMGPCPPGNDGAASPAGGLPSSLWVNPYTGEERPALPEGQLYVWKYELDRYGWHHGWISVGTEGGLQALEVKTKRQIGARLEAAATQGLAVRLRWNEKNYVTVLEYVEDLDGKPLTDEDVPF